MIKDFRANNKSIDERKKKSSNEHFSEFLRELGRCDENAQRQKILEMNEIIDEMEEEEFESVFTKEMFDEMDVIIKVEKLSMRNVIFLLKQIGHCYELKNVWNRCFEKSLLCKRFEKMIINEKEKTEDKDERLLYLLLKGIDFNLCTVPSESCIEQEEKQGNSKGNRNGVILDYELYRYKIKEIILYHQKHNNLTRLACQSSWQFLVNGLPYYDCFEGVIVNELHFAREAARELEELMKSVDWKRKEEERGRETKEELVLLRWLKTLERYFLYCTMWNEEFVGLLNCIVRVFLAAKDNYREVYLQCIHLLKKIADNKAIEIDVLLKGGAVNAVLEKMQLQTLNKYETYEFLVFFIELSIRLKEKKDHTTYEAKRKATKKEFLEKMEEEGYEDTITSFHEIFIFFNRQYYHGLSLNISDYFVNA
eukprot:MONOS_12294.1-p1 / transcript=MONOS_12294.1 / gene=MONOS_12294 / organism=Monocercomonoides_exilis_PA203 / gene_product=unspecified product / transcript_product=unspecified product / location=Mono_scaffold00671:29332-30863(-) / protein_length=423 / sequence_SO=supercontig / SO=protein_coding / is_pseudo=false